MAYFTKKQKRQMLERKRRKKKACETGTNQAESGDKKEKNKGKEEKEEEEEVTPGERETLKATNKKRKRNEDEHDNQQESDKEQVEGHDVVAKNDDDDEVQDHRSKHDSMTITVPRDLSSKAAKKFRKDARRKARAEGKDDTILKFVIEGDDDSILKENDDEQQQAKKKQKKWSFPSINKIVKEQQKEMNRISKQEEAKEQEEHVPVHIKRRYLALDCEMVGIGSSGKRSVLARVSIVDWFDNTVLDTFVQVPTRVTDFRTEFSGVTSKKIKQGSGAMKVDECRNRVADIIKDKILVGHALKNDFTALMLQHPRDQIRDTAKYRPLQRLGRNQKWRPRKLRDLVKEYLDWDIQQGHGAEGHDSVEDAKATMSLFKLFRDSWENELLMTKSKKNK